MDVSQLEPLTGIVLGGLGNFAGKLFGDTWCAVWEPKFKSVAAGVYSQWMETVAGNDDEKKARALAAFFQSEVTISETGKVLKDQYRDVDFDVLDAELRVSCKTAGVPPPKVNIPELLDSLVRDLVDLLDENPEFAKRYQKPLRRAMEVFAGSEASIQNDSVARQKYLAQCVKHHKFIHFGGMAHVDDHDSIPLEKAFVMPRVVELAKDAKPVEAHRLLTGRKPPRKIVILGKPGAGKTTLLSCLTLELAASRRKLKWAQQLPTLLPVFVRVRDLDLDLVNHPGSTIWDSLRRECTRVLQMTVPFGFLRRQMARGGLLFLFDGLDEASTAARRHTVMDAIRAFTDTLGDSSRVVITSRPHDYADKKFDSAEFTHYDLCEFDKDEIKTFVERWQAIHEPDSTKAARKTKKLLDALERHEQIGRLAPNALLLAMIVKVHFSGGGNLPDTRAELYAKCSETMLKTWIEAKGFPASPLTKRQKEKFLGRLAYKLQTSDRFANAKEGVALTLKKRELEGDLETFLKEATGPSQWGEAEALVERLHAREGVLVDYGREQFGFVHRTFQEYFAGWHLAEERREELERLAFLEPRGWNETLYLGVAQLNEEARRSLLEKLVTRSRVVFALRCLESSENQDRWLQTLIPFLARRYSEAREYRQMTPGEAAQAVLGRAELPGILGGLFRLEDRAGPALAAAVELAEELAELGDKTAKVELEKFWAEANACPEDPLEEMVEVGDGILMGKYPVTNLQFERMVPGRNKGRYEVSLEDDQPVVAVNRYEAELYCRWRGGGATTFRLPSEEEWLRAWGDKKYPWGDEFDKTKCNTRESDIGKTTPVERYNHWPSPAGCCDLAGNVWEWTSSQWSPTGSSPVIRGGSWYLSSLDASRSGGRNSNDPESRYSSIGFRCSRT